MAKRKPRFNNKFIIDFFKDKNTIVRKNDEHKWRVEISSYNIYEDNHVGKCLGDESLAQFFDENNNFKYDEYDIFYHDYFKDFWMNELKTNGAKSLNSMVDDAIRGKGDTKKCEDMLKKIYGV